jgi:hypothetical protein
MVAGMGFIEKTEISNLKYQKQKLFPVSQNLIVLVKISPFRMKKFEINEPIRYETFSQQSVFKMFHFDIVQAKKNIRTYPGLKLEPSSLCKKLEIKNCNNFTWGW